MCGEMEDPGGPRFMADRMLGKLARYLRLLGYDVVYPGECPDSRLLAGAREEGRVLLTRDRGICSSSGAAAGSPRVVEIRSSQPLEQLAQLVSEGWVHGAHRPRCPLCNSRLDSLEHFEARHLLPPYILATHLTNLWCARCNLVLWEGSHWERFRDRVSNAWPASR